MAADQVVTALLGAFDAQSNERAASQEALQGWEGMPGYTPLLLQLYAAPPPRLTPDARLLAVVCLKNAVTRHWNARRSGVLSLLQRTFAGLVRCGGMSRSQR